MSAAQYLDQLDQLRAAGTPGPWQAELCEGELTVSAGFTLPQLATALREVLKLADRWRREGERLGDDGSIHDRHGKAIQFAISDALSPAADRAEAEQ